MSEIRKVYQRFIDECENMMSNAEHRKKVADADYHVSERQHQEGRWHCALDLQKWAEGELSSLSAPQPASQTGAKNGRNLCPCCKSADIEWSHDGADYWYVECRSCRININIPIDMTNASSLAIDLWNSLTVPNPQPASNFVSQKQPENVNKDVCLSQDGDKSYDPSASLYGEGEEERMKHGAAKREAGENPAGIATPLTASQTGVEDAIAIIADYHAHQGARNQWNNDVPILEDRKPSIQEYKAALNTLRSLTTPTPQPASAALEAVSIEQALKAIAFLEELAEEGVFHHSQRGSPKKAADDIRQALAQCVPDGWVLVEQSKLDSVLRMARLIEEASEVSKIACKSIRFGEEFINPITKIPNNLELKGECADLSVVMEQAVNCFDDDFLKFRDDKRQKIEIWKNKEQFASSPVAGKGE